MQQRSSEKGPASRDWERGVSPSGGRLQPGSAGNLKDSARGGDARHGGTDLPIRSGHLTILHGCAHFTLTSRVRQIGGFIPQTPICSKKGRCSAANLGDDSDTTAAVFGQLAGAEGGRKRSQTVPPK
jgi:hypothetical protein